MKKAITLTVLAVFLSIPCFARNFKIAHFDLQKVIGQSQAGKDAREKYRQKEKQYQEDINKRLEILKKLKAEINTASEKIKQGDTLPSGLADKNKELNRQTRDLQRLRKGYGEELKFYDTELTREVMQKLRPVLVKFAQKNKYDYLYKNNNELVVFASEKRDVTDQVIKDFDSSYKP